MPSTMKTKRPLNSASKQEHRKRAKLGPGTKISLDDLDWKEVSMPDRLDDVEGFYGLEEVDGVDVITHENGKVEYNILDKPKTSKKKTKAPKPTVDAGEESERKGFSDSDDEIPETSENSATPEALAESEGLETKVKRDRKEQRKEQRERRKERQKQKKKEPNEAPKLSANPFESLPDEEEDDVELPAWDSLNLSLPILRGLSKLQFTKPTPIQSQAIPEIIAGHDVIGKASTGSGKTLAFGIPIIESYLAQQMIPNPTELAESKKSKSGKYPTALILSPTRELAHQLHAHLTAVSAFAPDFRVVSLTGGLSLQKQLRQLGDGVDVIVATPGRLWEVVSEGQGWIDKLRKIRFLVVDEADRLLQEGHFKEVEEVLNLLSKNNEDEVSEDDDTSEEDINATEAKKKAKSKHKKKSATPQKKRQTLVFSATFHQGLQQKLVSKGKKAWSGRGGSLMDQEESMSYLLKKLKFKDEKPKFIDVNPVGQLADQLREGIVECGAMEKDLYLYYLCLRYPCRTLVFTNSISSVKRLAPLLTELQLSAHPLHSNMIQKARLRNLERFASETNKNTILIATDVAARGLDIKGVDMVIHYHLPRTADMYVHRSGRTARADARGISVLLCAPEEVTGVRRLVGKVHEGEAPTGRYMMKSFGVDRKLVSRLKKRVELAKKITDSTQEKQKKNHEDEWLKNAAEELGVDYDSDEFRNMDAGKKGNRGKAKKEKAASATKAEVGSWRAELKQLMQQKVNSGFSQRYLTSGTVNLAQALLEEDVMHDQILGVEKRNVIDEVAW